MGEDVVPGAQWITRRNVALAAVVGGLGVLVTSATIVGLSAGSADVGCCPVWVAVWAARSLGGGSTGFRDQTVRNVVYTSVGGSEVRVRLSNTFGRGPVVVGAAGVGVVLDGAGLVPSTI